MQIENFSDEGRTLLIEFKCRRCKKTHVETLKEAWNNSGEHYGRLHNFKEPEGWSTINYGTLLCKDCIEKYNKFISNEAVE